jgi:hypothetical protein
MVKTMTKAANKLAACFERRVCMFLERKRWIGDPIETGP